MNTRELVATNFEVFKRMSPENRAQQIQAAQYIQYLQATNNVPFEQMNVFEVFSSGKGNALLTDKKEINVKFFEWLTNKMTKVPKEALAIEKDILDKIQAEIQNQSETVRRSINDAIRRSLSEAERYADRRDMSIREAFQYMRRLESIAPVKTKVNPVLLIEDICKDGFYTFKGYKNEGCKLEFSTIPITWHKVNKSAGIDIKVHFGSYLVTWNIMDSTFSVRPYKNNIASAGHTHPYVSGSGSICFGSAEDHFRMLVKDRKYIEIFKLIAELLSTHADSNPYQSIEYFAGQNGREPTVHNWPDSSAEGKLVRNTPYFDQVAFINGKPAFKAAKPEENEDDDSDAWDEPSDEDEEHDDEREPDYNEDEDRAPF